MLIAPLPPDEEARLCALQAYHVLDTPPEPGFDDITLLTAQLLGTPMVLISLTDRNRQWFKSSHGLDGSESPRDSAFCAHAILGREPMIVSDATADPRFFDNPAVLSAPHVRFYAGMPLITPAGHALGTLCAVDRVPRTLSAAQVDALRRMAGQVVTLLELRRARDQALSLADTAFKTEIALRESESLLARTGAVAGVGGWELDLVREVLIWSRETMRIHEVEPGYRPSLQDALGFYTPKSRVLIDAAVKKCVADGTPYDLELELVSAKGRTFWARATGTAEYEDGRPVRLVGAFQEITERRHMEIRLRAASADADKANKAKSEFLANMSHEIRTPLNAVIGLGYLLEQSALSEDQRQFVTKIQFAGRALLGVINNVLDLSKIEAGEMSLENDTFDLPALVRDLSQMLAPQAAAKGIELVVDFAYSLPRVISGDVSRLRQILTNLLNNAIKFTEVGRVELRLNCIASGTQDIRIRCEVIDTGIGIDPATITRLFTPFTQADPSTTRRFGGTGLGLSIAHRFVELMGGKIGVDSVPGQGSTFWLEIPVRVSGEMARGAGDAAAGLQIMIADPAGAGALGTMVSALGWCSESFATPDELFAALKLRPPEMLPEAIVIALPTQADEARRLLERLAVQCPVADTPPAIVITELTQSYLEHQPLLRASDVLLLRPVTSSNLFNAINGAVWRRYDDHDRLLRATNFDERHAQWLGGVRILVADDSDINLVVAQRILEKQGATVFTCGDGAAAFEHVRAHGHDLDIVLMDVQMPLLDGNEATRRIRGELRQRALPIVACTAGALVAERQQSLDAGMNDFIAKPFDPQALIRKVRRLVEETRGEPIPVLVTERKQADARTTRPLMPSIDAEVVQQLFGEDVALFKSLLARVLRDYADMALPVSITDGGPAARSALMARTHKLKGSAGMIGASGLMRLAGAAEKALQDDRADDVIEALLKKIASALTTLREEAAPVLAILAESTGAVAESRRSNHAIDPSELDELCELLDRQNLAAIDRFEELSQALTDHLSTADFDRLRAAIDALDFAAGAELLRRAALPNRLYAVQ